MVAKNRICLKPFGYVCRCHSCVSPVMSPRKVVHKAYLFGHGKVIKREKPKGCPKCKTASDVTGCLRRIYRCDECTKAGVTVYDP